MCSRGPLSSPGMFALLLAAATCVSVLPAGQPEMSLVEGFVEPPLSTQPRVYWWWPEGNVSKAGITRDLEEIKRKGIGGALLFDGSSAWFRSVRRSPAGLPFMSPQWREMFRHAVREADRLGLEISFNLGSGYPLGGHWITPEHNLQRFVWSETEVQGPARFSEPLAIASDVERDSDGRPLFYRDIAVQAIQLPDPPQPVTPIKHWDLKAVKRLLKHVPGHALMRERAADVPGECDVARSSILDLSGRLDEGGRLVWDVPAGNWLVLRFGHTFTGKRVRVHSPDGGGLILDALSPEALDVHFAALADPLLEDLGELAGKSLKYFHNDSPELRLFNWTGRFTEEFRRAGGSGEDAQADN